MAGFDLGRVELAGRRHQRLQRFIAEGVAVARRALRVIRQNLAWAFAYNVSAIPLAMVGWITPWMAGIGMSASSLLVVMNALRLQGRAHGKG